MPAGATSARVCRLYTGAEGPLPGPCQHHDPSEGAVIQRDIDPARAGRARLAAIVAALVLGACAAPPKPLGRYMAPTSGPTAKLVMRGSVPPGDLYGIFVFDDSEKCSGS